MQHVNRTGILLLLFLVLFACKKDDEEKANNVLMINSGTDAGFAYVYSPNMGFWTFATETVKSVHLVFGDTDDQVINGKDIMSMYFYDEGTGSVSFPSAQGQHINIGLTINGSEKYYSVEDAVLSILEITDNHFKGNLSGTFISGGPEFESVTMSMEIDIQLSEII